MKTFIFILVYPREKGKMKILCIDEDGDTTLLCRSVFESENYEFTSINTGKEGIQLIHDFKYDLVLLDIENPEFNGKDVINSLQKENLIGKQPVILFTASSTNDTEIEEIMVQGVYQCLRKPIKSDVVSSFFKGLTKNNTKQTKILKKWPLRSEK